MIVMFHILVTILLYCVITWTSTCYIPTHDEKRDEGEEGETGRGEKREQSLSENANTAHKWIKWKWMLLMSYHNAAW